MASEHIVKLKAILDTSEVRSKLQSMQNAGQAGSNGLSQQAQLTQVLNRLNVTLTQLNSTAKSAQRNGNSAASNPSQFARIGRWLLGGHVLGSSLNSLGSYFKSSGNQNAANAVGYVKSVGEGAAAGAAFGGIPGAVIGAAGGGLSQFFDNLAQTVKECTAQLEAWNAGLKAGTEQQNKVNKMFEASRYAQLMESKATGFDMEGLVDERQRLTRRNYELQQYLEGNEYYSKYYALQQSLKAKGELTGNERQQLNSANTWLEDYGRKLTEFNENQQKLQVVNQSVASLEATKAQLAQTKTANDEEDARLREESMLEEEEKQKTGENFMRAMIESYNAEQAAVYKNMFKSAVGGLGISDAMSSMSKIGMHYGESDAQTANLKDIATTVKSILKKMDDETINYAAAILR